MEDQISQIGSSNKKKRFNFFTFLIQVLILSALIYGAWWAYSHGLIKSLQNNGQTSSAQEEIKSLLEKVSKHIILPSQEEPALATVIDASKLKQEDPFYLNAENGDKLLIWATQRRAILYSPERDLLVNVGPVLFSGTMSAPQGKIEPTSSAPQVQVVESTPTSSEPLKIQILNGSGVSGAASKLAKEIESDVLKVVSTGNAKNIYESLMIVNLTGKNVSVLKDKLGIEPITALPNGELSNKTADVVIIIGKK